MMQLTMAILCVIAIVVGGLLVDFIFLALRQGMKVMPDNSGNGSNSDNMQSADGS